MNEPELIIEGGDNLPPHDCIQTLPVTAQLNSVWKCTCGSYYRKTTSSNMTEFLGSSDDDWRWCDSRGRVYHQVPMNPWWMFWNRQYTWETW